jgi:hypothetical protein
MDTFKMKNSLSKSEIVWEVLGGICVFAAPILVLFIGKFMGL